MPSHYGLKIWFVKKNIICASIYKRHTSAQVEFNGCWYFFHHCIQLLVSLVLLSSSSSPSPLFQGVCFSCYCWCYSSIFFLTSVRNKQSLKYPHKIFMTFYFVMYWCISLSLSLSHSQCLRAFGHWLQLLLVMRFCRSRGRSYTNDRIEQREHLTHNSNGWQCGALPCWYSEIVLNLSRFSSLCLFVVVFFSLIIQTLSFCPLLLSIICFFTIVQYITLYELVEVQVLFYVKLCVLFSLFVVRLLRAMAMALILALVMSLPILWLHFVINILFVIQSGIHLC